jgi:hypothetical protein
LPYKLGFWLRLELLYLREQLARTVLTWGNYGNFTIPDALGINHWFIIVAIVASGIVLFRWLEKNDL